ncbi:hypothetical protein PENSTE_c005G07633 [Penicillium steckii]|uniref:Aminoglycoside phosphotransferase domain-containing protein n=1 Tax=Penicillium steckii TaxID=303698 RepID=A0A1V6TJY5_9EURO|nr:hypothetical protein PENSTE_c005G07633 [Penicillium steckii]
MAAYITAKTWQIMKGELLSQVPTLLVSASARIHRSRYEKDSLAVLTVGAKKEIAYFRKFGRDLQPFQRLRREIYNYQPQSYLEHISSLEKFIKIAPHLLPDSDFALNRPTIRHPDLQPNNIFISDDFGIEGIIDWQHATVLPLFLQCGIPENLRNYGDKISESLQLPTLPDDFAALSEIQRLQQTELLRKRQLHYFYVKKTETMNPDHYHALTHDFSALRRRLFQHTSDPWEGGNVTLKADLVALSRTWNKIYPGTKKHAQFLSKAKSRPNIYRWNMLKWKRMSSFKNARRQ